MRNRSARKSRRSNKQKVRKFARINSLLLKIAILFIVSAVVLLCVRWIVNKYQHYVREYQNYEFDFVPGDQVQEYNILKTEEPFNILLVGLDRKGSGHIKADMVILLHYAPLNKQIQLVGLPVKALYYDSFSDSYQTLQNIYAWGQIKSPERGMTDLLRVLQESLALKVSGYIAADFQGIEFIFDKIGKVQIDNPVAFTDNDIQQKFFDSGVLDLSGIELLDFVRADEGGYLMQLNRQYSVLQSLFNKIDKWDLYRIAGSADLLQNHFFSNISADSARKLVSKIINDDSFTIDAHVPDNVLEMVAGSEYFNSALADDFLLNVVDNSEIIREQARIEVYNGTSVNGLASKYSRWIENAGGDVIRISNQSGDYSQTLIYVSNLEKYQNTVTKIQEIFPEGALLTDSPAIASTGDIIVILGEDAVDL